MTAQPARKRKAVGLPPGTIVHVGPKPAEDVRITIMDYDASGLREHETKSVDECLPFKESPTVTWINVNGIHDVATIEKLGAHFGLHPLTLEDIAHARQRPKLEAYEDYAYVVVNMFHGEGKVRRVRAEQVSVILTENCVITFREGTCNVLDPVRERIRGARGRMRKMGADYLAYAILDTIVDNCLGVLETVGERVERLDEALMKGAKPETLRAIHSLKREVIKMRKSLWPLRDVVSVLERGDSPLIRESTGVYLRDLYDHTVQAIETTETYREMISGMMEIYLSIVSNRMNEVMKVLTIIATIFIPLTFIAGIYGMNFQHMPETEMRWGYPAILGVMAAVGAGMLIYFRRKKWL